MCVFFSSRIAAPLRAARDKDDLLRLLADRRGRRFLWRLLVRAGVFRNSVTGPRADGLAEGRRSLGLGVLNDILAADPSAYLAMIEENRRSEDRCDLGMSIL